MSSLSASWLRVAASSRLRRSSQALSIVGSKAWIFGGELVPRQPVDNQLDVIDLDAAPVSVDTVLAPEQAPSPRVGTASVGLDGKLYLFSGRGGLAMDAVDEDGSLWCFSTATSTWAAITAQSESRPAPRSYHAMTSDGVTIIYLHAGCPAQGRLSDLWAFDTVARQWTELPSAPGPARGGTSIAYCGGKLYRMGGFDGKTEQGGSLDVYDPAAKEWSSIAFKPDGVEGPRARSVASLLAVTAPTGRQLLVTMFGERDPSSLGHAGAGKMLSDVWAFDMESRAWSQVAVTGDAGSPPPRGWFDADVLTQDGGDAIVVHGGLAEDNSRLGDVWKLQFQ
ncbi:Kelch repeat protein [Tolypocladium paradoxum]|uniref:Kelch repeat protein n=1 Tax=Tolypocladium paradoxum TaxID=94208 RepID=A0A2S4L9N4_9HYPO|nr:Kelch repeat protein [Tolypocladium paradoxum]